MFSEEDVKDVFQIFPPSKDSATSVSQIILSSRGNSFSTLQHLRSALESRLSKETQRVRIHDLARDLEVEESTVLQLIEAPSDSILLSRNDASVIPITMRKDIQDNLNTLIHDSLVSKSDYSLQNDVSPSSLEVLLGDLKVVLVQVNGHVCSKDYENFLSEAITLLLENSVENLVPVDIRDHDLKGHPPTWFTIRVLTHVLKAKHLTFNFYIEKQWDGIRCTPKLLAERKRDAAIGELQSGKRAYINLTAFWKDFPELYNSLDEGRKYMETLPDVEILDSVAISDSWMVYSVEEWLADLSRNGYVDLSQRVRTNFPSSLLDQMLQRAAQATLAASAKQANVDISQFRDLIVTSQYCARTRQDLCGFAQADAHSQWQHLKNNPESEIRFSLANIVSMTTNNQPVMSILVKERAVEKELDQQFWASVSEQETENETQFATYWTDRVVSRCHIYNEGLDIVEDQKLRDQLAELFATYTQKELFPDSLSKARSQGLVFSRKTRKNVARFESVTKSSKMDTASVFAAIDKFNKKQSIETPHSSGLADGKKAMVSDMIRRMQKQKQSDGPLLFLTLVVILFAKHHPGVVYATGKFAPKLLKQLKVSLAAEQYEQLEKWKEAAKAGTLSAEDRQDMKKLAEA